MTVRGVAMWWTVDWVGHVHPYALLPEVVPEIDANAVSFYSGGVGVGVGHGLENEANLLLPLGTQS